MRPTRLVSLVLLTLASFGALAGDTVIETRVRIDASASVEDIYRTLRLKAARLCRTHAVRPYDRVKAESQCRADFMNQAVLRIDRPELTALHGEATAQQPRWLAELETDR